MIRINRFQNGKLYDRVTSCFISLDVIFQLYSSNVSFEVIDNKTKEDMTQWFINQSIIRHGVLK